ncbi:MAG TPA: 23S rRNA (guanosine(2251)-2'-O)-methyltransferase RlmB [Gammaproteobacteria bacterium]|jgi:23S rRNA (guanosine2251-2'-O)-methyltransferase|nr:23S rRNA (guanosine(2251)-2'-O)-methyltransferase RlmB [Gammaproteobacteria bacterium]
MSADKQYIFGIHAVTALIEKHPERIIRVLAAVERGDKKLDAVIKLARRNGIEVRDASRPELDRLTGDGNHQGVAALCDKPETFSESDLPAFLENLQGPAFLLILDGVQDPHNLGACFRSADAAGVHAVIAPKDKAVGITPVVSKVACGAAETVPFFQVTNLARTMEMLKEQGVWLYGAAGEADATLYQTDFRGAVGIVMGAEGEGMRRLTREKCDGLVKIPMRGTVESLNVSVATGVMLFEVLRQRTK